MFAKLLSIFFSKAPAAPEKPIQWNQFPLAAKQGPAPPTLAANSFTGTASDNQIAYVKRLGGTVGPTLSFEEASQLIDQLIQEEWRVERANRLYGEEKPASSRQKFLIECLDGKVTPNMSQYQASQLIDQLQQEEWRVKRKERIYAQGYPVSPRQQMVARFWDIPLKKTREEATEWQNTFYLQDPDYRKAWELWKEEHKAEEITDNPEVVPQGIGIEYLQRVKDKKHAAAIKKTEAAHKSKKP
jgi:hypothetical protein